MTTRARIASVLLYIVSALIAFMGIVDIAVREPPANYFEYMGTTATDLDPRIGDVIYAFRAKIGVFALAVAGVIVFFARRFCDGDRLVQAALMLSILLLAVGIPALTYNMGPGPNVFVPPILGVLASAAFLLTRNPTPPPT